MSIKNTLKKVMLDEMVNHKPYGEMNKQEFKAFQKSNLAAYNKYRWDNMQLFVHNLQHVFPDGVINLKKNDKGFKLSELKRNQIIDAWTFNQKRHQEYLYSTNDLGKEVDPDTFFMNVLDWTEDTASKDIDRKVEHIRDTIMKKMEQETLSNKVPFDITVIGDYDDLEKEGFFKKYPNLK